MSRLNALERALKAVNGEEPDKVPIVLQVYALVLKSIHGVSEYEYYHNVDLQLEAKIEFIRTFPEVYNLPMGVLPEYGEFIGPIPTAFGAKIGWHEDAPPYVAEYPIKSLEDVDRLVQAGVPDPHENGITSEILHRTEYFVEKFPRDLREKYGYLDGTLHPGALIEGAALTMGYDKFLIWMRRYPDVVHKWLKHVTDFYLKYCEAIEEIVGKCRILFLPDHMASMVGREYFNEFILPYLNRVFNKYHKALRIWHNEGRCGHMLDAVDKLNAEVWQCGPKDDVLEIKENTHFTVCGNIHPPSILKMTPKELEDECRKLILKAATGGRFWLGTGGGMAPGTSPWHIRAFIRAVEKYGVYPIRRN